MKKNFSISGIDQKIAVLEDSQYGSTFLDDFVYGGGSEFKMPIDNIPSSTGFPTFFDDSVVQQQSACMVYQNQSDADWMGDYQMCDGTWQYGGYIGAGATVCLVSGTAFTLSGMDLVPLYPCGDSEPPIYPQPPIYGEPQTIEMPVEPPVYQKPQPQPYYPPNEVELPIQMPVEKPQPIYGQAIPETTFIDDFGGSEFKMPIDNIPSSTGFPTFFPQPPIYGEPQIIEMPIQMPVEKPQPIYGQAIPETTFIDDNTFRIITELPAMPQAMEQIAIMERMPQPAMPSYGDTLAKEIEMPIEQPTELPAMPQITAPVMPIDQFISGTALVTCPDGTTDIANGIVEPCIGHDKVPAASTPSTPSTPTALPTKPVSKNLTPYIYAGLGIIVILVVARMVTKK